MCVTIERWLNGTYNRLPTRKQWSNRWKVTTSRATTSVEFRARACYFKTELFSRLLGAKLAHETYACRDHDLLSTQNNCSHCSNLLFFLFTLVTFPNLGQTDFLACWARNCQTEPISLPLSNFYCAGRRRALLVCVCLFYSSLYFLDLVKTTNFCVLTSSHTDRFELAGGLSKMLSSFFLYL